MSTLQDVETAASTVGLNMLGLAAPLLTIRWTADRGGTGPASDPTEGSSGTLTLAISSGEQWIAPAAGVLSFATPGNRILKTDGTPAAADAALFRIHGQAYLRLARLIRAVIEGGNDGLPIRPVPLFFVYSGTDITGATAGTFAANAPMGLKGRTPPVPHIPPLAISPPLLPA